MGERHVKSIPRPDNVGYAWHELRMAYRPPVDPSLRDVKRIYQVIKSAPLFPTDDVSEQQLTQRGLPEEPVREVLVAVSELAYMAYGANEREALTWKNAAEIIGAIGGQMKRTGKPFAKTVDWFRGYIRGVQGTAA